jgi:hypothetical protein
MGGMHHDMAINSEIIECTLDPVEESKHKDPLIPGSHSYPTSDFALLHLFYAQTDSFSYLSLLHRSSSQPQAPPFLA